MYYFGRFFHQKCLKKIQVKLTCYWFCYVVCQFQHQAVTGKVYTIALKIYLTFIFWLEPFFNKLRKLDSKSDIRHRGMFAENNPLFNLSNEYCRLTVLCLFNFIFIYLFTNIIILPNTYCRLTVFMICHHKEITQNSIKKIHSCHQ